MSELFAVEVRSVGKSKATLAIKSVHPDSGPVPESLTFALMLLFDPIAQSGSRRAFAKLAKAPLAAEIDERCILDSSWVKKNAPTFVAGVTLRRGGLLDVSVENHAWIEHLKPKMRWETAAFDVGPAARARSKRGVAAKANEGFRKGAFRIKDENFTVTRGKIATLGPSRYIAEPTVKGTAAMTATVKKLLGDVVLLVPKRGLPRVVTVASPPKKSGFFRKLGFYEYHESESSRGGGFVALDELRALGPASLKA